MNNSVKNRKKAIIAIVLSMAVTIGIIAFLIVDEYTYCKQVRHVNEIISAMQNDDTEAFSTLINDPSRSVERPRRSALSWLAHVFFSGLLRMDSVPTSSCLEEACRTGNPFYVEKLLESGANPNKYMKDEYLPPLLSVLSCRYDEESKDNIKLIIELLLAHGADVNIQDSWGQNALIHLFEYEMSNEETEQCQYELAVLLTEHSIDKNHKDHNGMTAYDYAVKNGYSQSTIELLKP